MSEETTSAGSESVTTLRPDLVLHRTPELDLHIHSDNRIRIILDGKTITCAPHALSILEAFRRPRPFSEALKELGGSSAGMQDWAALTSTMLELYQAGVLRDETQSGPEDSYGFGSPSVHVRMLNDKVRTTSFFAGIEEVVSAGDVVVDVGTGTGVLAIAAARAGARHVYAIEASGIGGVAEAVFEANGVADRITLLRGWSTQVTLPERADVLVGEIIGDDPLAEHVLQVTMDARKRLLKPEARLVPGGIKVFALPVSIPLEEKMRRVVTTEALRTWHSWYGMDFGPLMQVERASGPLFYVKPQRTSTWKVLGEPVLLADVDLGRFSYPMSLDQSVISVAKAAGRLDGLLMYFELGLGPTSRLTTSPAEASQDNHWRSPVWVLESPLQLQRGDQFQVICRYRSGNYAITVARA